MSLWQHEPSAAAEFGIPLFPMQWCSLPTWAPLGPALWVQWPFCPKCKMPSVKERVLIHHLTGFPSSVRVSQGCGWGSNNSRQTPEGVIVLLEKGVPQDTVFVNSVRFLAKEKCSGDRTLQNVNGETINSNDIWKSWCSSPIFSADSNVLLLCTKQLLHNTHSPSSKFFTSLHNTRALQFSVSLHWDSRQ